MFSGPNGLAHTQSLPLSNGYGNGSGASINGNGHILRAATIGACSRDREDVDDGTSSMDDEGFDESEEDEPEWSPMNAAFPGAGGPTADLNEFGVPTQTRAGAGGADHGVLPPAHGPAPAKRRKFWKRMAMRCVERYDHSKKLPGAALSSQNRNCCLSFSFANAPTLAEDSDLPAPVAAGKQSIDSDCEKAFSYFFTKVRARNMRVANLILSFMFMLYALFSFSRDFNTAVLVARGMFLLFFAK
jgi:hypothetical protein